MKLQTSIAPRRDGKVIVQGQDRQTYEFVAGPDGELSCDIEDEATIVKLLATDKFYPADPEDADKALQLVHQQAGDDGDGDEDKGTPTGDDLNDDTELEDAGNGGLPIEANTPPQTSPDKAAKANGAIQKAAKAAKAK